MQNRFKPVDMKTNQMFQLLRLLFLLIFLLISSSSFGQYGTITDITSPDIVNGVMEIKMIPPPSLSKLKKNKFKIGDTIYSGSKLTIPQRTKISIQSINGNNVTFRGFTEFIYTVTPDNEDQRITANNNNNGSSHNNVSKEVNGGVTSTSPDRTEQLKTHTTEFLVDTNGSDLTFELIEGKVVINRRISITLKEDLSINSDGNREIFVNDPIIVTPKKPKSSYNVDSIRHETLNNEKVIDSFFKKQLVKQKRELLNAGPISKSAFKSLNKNDYSITISQFETSINRGELQRGLLIQSSLLLSEAYLNNENKEISTLWLNVALYFTEIELRESKELYEYYLDNHENDAAKTFGNDLIISNKYNAWAYTVKLKLTGCLESPDQNPRKWLDEAKNLRTDLDKL